MKREEIIKLTIDILEYGEIEGYAFTISAISEIIEQIEQTRSSLNNNYTVSDWAEDTQSNYPEFLDKYRD